MNKILRLMRLDYLSMKKHFSIKDILVLLLGFIISSSIYKFKSELMIMLMFYICTFVFTMLPFIITGKSDIDSLYSVLGIERKSIVLYRYLYLLLIDLILLVISNITTFLMLLILQKSLIFQESIYFSFQMFLACIFLQSIVLPFCFKRGDFKSFIANFVFHFNIGLAFVDNNIFYNKGNNFDNLVIVRFLFLLAFLLVSIKISYHASLFYYKKRDF